LVVPSPSWPAKLLPQHLTPPRAVSAQVWPTPASIALASFPRPRAQIDGEEVTAETVRASLSRFRDGNALLKPGERKELMRLLLKRAEVGDRQIVLEIYPVTTPEMAMPQSRSRSEAPNWLPGQEMRQH